MSTLAHGTYDQELRHAAERAIYARLPGRPELTEMSVLVDLVVKHVMEAADPARWNEDEVALAVTLVIADALDLLGRQTREQEHLRRVAEELAAEAQALGVTSEDLARYTLNLGWQAAGNAVAEGLKEQIAFVLSVGAFDSADTAEEFFRHVLHMIAENKSRMRQ